VVRYFHQVDDPYSHLAVQKLAALVKRYKVAFEPHLVGPPEAAFQGDAKRFVGWALQDAAAIAPGYGLSFGEEHLTQVLQPPPPDQVRTAQQSLAQLLDTDVRDCAKGSIELAHSVTDFAHAATTIGNALWQQQPISSNTANAHRLTADALNAHLQRANTLRTRLSTDKSLDLVCPPPMAQALPSGADVSQITLEYFPSLRSPYTAIGHSRVADLIHRTGVNVAVRPVMPMLMRGIPAPANKQRYIISDAAREARYYNEPFGNFVDPFGDPVKRAFALFPAASRQDKGLEFVGAYLRAAFAEGTDITSDTGLALVAQNAGLELSNLQRAATGDDWEAVLEDNLQRMLAAGLWGVPSFRVSGGTDKDPFACWGQDRIWLVENEITRRAN